MEANQSTTDQNSAGTEIQSQRASSNHSLFVITVISILLTAVITGPAVYLWQKSASEKAISNLEQKITSLEEQSSVKRTMEITPHWKKLVSTRCGFEIQYLVGWHARETRLVPGTDNPELHYGCIDILAPDYNFEDEKIVGSSLPKEFYIKISRTKLGTEFKSVKINSLEDYIESEENIWEPPANVDYKTSVFGKISGKEYIFGGFGTFHNFIFKQDGYIFNVSWPVGHEDGYGSEENIDQILSTFKFTD